MKPFTQEQDFAFHPTGGLPRIIRFVTEEKMPRVTVAVNERVVSHLDASRNVLTVNKEVFDQLDAYHQDRIIKTTSHVCTIS